MGHDVFISYSHRDQKIADAACARLEQAGHRCWIAPRDIGGGEWGKAIVDGIRGARLFVLIFSVHANRSPQVNREVERAVSKGLPIIPFRIENIVPSDALEYFISNQHWLDAMTPPLERHLDQLTEMVGNLLGSSALPPSARVQSAARRGTKLWLAGAALAVVAIAGVGAWIYQVSTRAPDSPGVVVAPVSNAMAQKGLEPRLTRIVDCSATFAAVGNLFGAIAETKSGAERDELMQTADQRRRLAQALRARAIAVGRGIGVSEADVEARLAAAKRRHLDDSQAGDFAEFAGRVGREADQCTRGMSELM